MQRERLEFIEKFKKDKRIDTLASYTINPKMKNISQISSRTNKVENNSLSYMQTDVPKRWDYLHQLDKVRQNKIQSKIQKQNEENERKHHNECTFNPVIYTKKTAARSKSTGKIINYMNSSNINELNSDDLVNCNVNQRTLIHHRKKEVKIENIKQQLLDREVEECFFKPKTNQINSMDYLTIPTEEKLIDKNSYFSYVSRIKNKRQEREKEEKRSQSKPGSGNCWKKGITISNEFNLLTENPGRRELNRSGYKGEIKSLYKPLVLNKFCVEKGTKQVYQRPKSTEKVKLSEVNIDKAMTYEKAMSYLHSALNALDI